MGYYVYCFEDECFQEKPTEAYVKVVEQMLSDHPELIGEFETYFTTDMARAEKYTGATRYVEIAGQKVAIATGFGTAVKRKNLERVEKALYGEKKQVEDKNAKISEEMHPEAAEDVMAGEEEIEEEDEIDYEDEEEEDEVDYEEEDEEDEVDYEEEDEEDEVDYEEEDEIEEEEENDCEEEDDEVDYEEEDEDDEIDYEEEEEEDEIDYEEDESIRAVLEKKEEALTQAINIWKKPLPRLNELEYVPLENLVSVWKEEFKYKGERRYRFAVKKDGTTLFSFVPDFEMDSVARAWLWLDQVWMIVQKNCYGYGSDNFLCSIKYNGRKPTRLVESVGNIRDAYFRKDKESEILFVDEDKGGFLWYDVFTKKSRHLPTGISCKEQYIEEEGREIYDEEGEFLWYEEGRRKKDDHYGWQIFEDGHVLLNQEILYGADGESELIRDYLDCDCILSACKKAFFEDAFLKAPVCKVGNFEQIKVEWVRTDLKKEIQVKITEIDPDIVTVPMDGNYVWYQWSQLRLREKEEYSAEDLLRGDETLASLLQGMKKDLTLGYRVGEKAEVSLGYVYAKGDEELLLAISYATKRYLGEYSPEYKWLTMFEVNPQADGENATDRVAEFRKNGNAKNVDDPHTLFLAAQGDMDVRYFVDRSGFDVMGLLGEELTAFFRNKKIFDSNFKKEISFSKSDLRKRILHCAGLCVDDRIYWGYPPTKDGQVIPDDRIKGAVLIMDLKDFGYKKPMVVIFGKDRPNRIRVAENKPWSEKANDWKTNRSTWWESVKAGLRLIEIPYMATERDAAAIVPTLNPPEGVKFDGIRPGFVSNDLSVTTRLDDTDYDRSETDPMKQIYMQFSVSVIFEGKRRGKVAHPGYRKIRAGQCCTKGFLYATEKGAYYCMQDGGRMCMLIESDKVCGLNYLPEKRELVLYLFKGLRQYRSNEHRDILGGMSEIWEDSYHVDLEVKRYSEDEVIRFIRNQG